MSILTNNGKVFTLSGSVLNYTPPPPAPVYGIDFTNMATTSKCTRTDAAANFTDPQPAVAGGTGSSPFDNIMPWSGMVRSTDPNAGEVVAIPKFYFKWETDGTKATGLKISMEKKPGFSTSPSHMDRGDGKGERDVIVITHAIPINQLQAKCPGLTLLVQPLVQQLIV